MTGSEQPATPSPYAHPAPPPYTTGPAVPPVPQQPADRSAAWIPGTAALVLLVAAIVNFVATTGFPYNAPVEAFWSFGITLDLIGGFIALLVVTIIRARRTHERVPAPGVRPLAIAAASLAGLTALAWLLLGGAAFLGKLAAGERLRYYMDVNGTFFAGIPWMLAIVFGVVSIRRDRPVLHNALAIAAVVIGALVLVASLFSSIAYGRGLTD